MAACGCELSSAALVCIFDHELSHERIAIENLNQCDLVQFCLNRVSGPSGSTQLVAELQPDRSLRFEGAFLSQVAPDFRRVEDRPVVLAVCYVLEFMGENTRDCCVGGIK